MFPLGGGRSSSTRLLHGTLGQRRSRRLQLRHRRGGRPRRPVPQEPDLAAGLQVPGPQHGRQRVLFRPHGRAGPGHAAPDGHAPTARARTASRPPRSRRSSSRSRACCPAIPGCRRCEDHDGNNCIAYADLKSPDGFNTGDVRARSRRPGSSTTRTTTRRRRAIAKNLQNSLVGMFFHVNWLHDRWYEAGFDEASGNAQKDNFGRGRRRRRPDPRRGERLQRNRQRQHVHAGRRLQPAHADVRVRRDEPARSPHQQPRGAHHVPRDGALHHQPAGRQRQRAWATAGRARWARAGATSSPSA
jgi:hypothetical protein